MSKCQYCKMGAPDLCRCIKTETPSRPRFLSTLLRSERGLLYEHETNKVIDCSEADRIAQANGYNYAETIAEKLNGKRFRIDNDTLKITMIL